MSNRLTIEENTPFGTKVNVDKLPYIGMVVTSADWQLDPKATLNLIIGRTEFLKSQTDGMRKVIIAQWILLIVIFVILFSVMYKKK